MKSKKSQRNFNATNQFIVLSKRKAKKVTQNDYDKLALNAFHKLDYHIPHNMISTFSGYPFFFVARTTDVRDTYGTSLLSFGVLRITSRSWSGLARIFLNKNCNFFFSKLAPNQQMVLQS